MRTILLTEEQHRQLDEIVRRGSTPYPRERAAAILKVAAGETPAVVARQGLLRPHEPDTIYAWLNRFEAEGVEGLKIRPGRGRKPGRSPDERHGGGSHGGPAT